TIQPIVRTATRVYRPRYAFSPVERAIAWRSGVLGTKCVARNRAVATASIAIGSMSGERLRHDLRHVARQSLGVARPLQLRPCMRLPARIELLPAIEGARHSRRDLRVESVEHEN